MDLVISFIVFIGAMICCLINGFSMVIALFAGLAAFTVVGVRKGYKLKEIGKMGAGGLKDALLVVEIMFVIGFITAIWRASGTITFFVYYGIRFITPGLFLIITFLLSCLLSYALGTSFGVAGTVGVIFIALARSGNVNEVITAGVVMSGIYFGDRGSPVSSSAVLVANITKTDLLGNVKMMAKTAALPIAAAIAIYSALSIANPIENVDQNILHALTTEFNISPWCLVPAICMVLLPLIKVPVLYAMLASVVSGGLVSVFVEGMPAADLIKCMFTGYNSTGSLARIINGGGLVSMIEVVFIVGISSTYSGIFEGTKMLSSLESVIEKIMSKTGRFGCTIIVSFVTLAIFCNQTIASMMSCDILKRPYDTDGASREELAMDLENSVILLAGVVPWAIACSVPLSFMQVGYSAIFYSFFLYLVPIGYAIQKKIVSPFRNK